MQPLLIFALLAVTGPLSAQPLSLPEAQAKAVAVNPTLSRLRAKVEESRQRVSEAESGGNPRLDAYARSAYVTPEVGFATPNGSLPIVVHHNYAVGLVLEQAILTFGRLHWASQAAQLQTKSLEQEVTRQQQRLRYQVAIAYTRLQTARQTIEVAQTSLKARERLLSDLAVREKAGVSAKFELLVAEVARSQDEQRVVLAEQQSRLALTELQILLGLPRQTAVETVPLGELPSLDESPENALKVALQERAEVRAVAFAVEAAEAKVHLEESQSSPTLGLQSRFENRTSTAFQSNNQWSVGLEFRWPLFDGGLSAARTAQAQAVRQQMADSRRELEDQVRLEVESALVRWQTTKQNLSVAQRTYKSAQEAARVGELRFKAGVGTHQEVLDVQARLREAQQGVFEAQQAQREAFWLVELALGQQQAVPTISS